MSKAFFCAKLGMELALQHYADTKDPAVPQCELFFFKLFNKVSCNGSVTVAPEQPQTIWKQMNLCSSKTSFKKKKKKGSTGLRATVWEPPDVDKTTVTETLMATYGEVDSKVRVEGRNCLENSTKKLFQSDGNVLYLDCAVKLQAWIHLSKLIKPYMLKTGVFYHASNNSITCFFFFLF